MTGKVQGIIFALLVGVLIGYLLVFSLGDLAGWAKTDCDQTIIDTAHVRYEEELLDKVLAAEEFICLEEWR